MQRAEFNHRQFDRELEILSEEHFAEYKLLGRDIMWTEKYEMDDRTVYIDRLTFG